MKKDNYSYPLGFRPDAEMKQALERAAAADSRPVAAMIRVLLARILRQEGWLKAEPEPRRQPR